MIIRRICSLAVFGAFITLGACTVTPADDAAKNGDSTNVAQSGAPAHPVAMPAAVVSDTAHTSSSTVDYYSAATLSAAASALARGTSTGTTLGRHDAISYVEGRRTSDGGVEVHDDWSDVVFVQAGRATLRTGGRVTGSHAESGGEHRGGTMDGGTPRVVSAGDFVMIPAGTPHRYEIAAGDSLRYLTVKVRRTP